MSVLVLMNVSLFALLVATALMITRLRALYEATMLTALAGLLSASLFVSLDALDVAITEAAVGAGISTVLFLGALARTRSREAVTPRRKVWSGAAVAVLLGATLLYASQDLPPFADANTPVQTHPVTQTYLEGSQEDIGIPNTVTAVLASYRGYDTLGELAVVFTAGITVPLLLMRTRRRHERRKGKETVLTEYRILRVTSKILMPFILFFACYILAHEDYGPGGGFQAGVIFASGFVLYGLVFGIRGLERVVPWRVLLRLIPAGVLLYAGLGLLNMALGGSFLDYGTLVPDHPEEGEHYGILVIETGVGITVAAALIAVFYSFASPEAGPATPPEASPEPSTEPGAQTSGGADS
jgi:multicomponent Na+:H+ antiporter subunit B